jgi:hypothetical protein
VNVPIGLVATVAVASGLAGSHRAQGRPPRIDVPALILVAAGTVALIWALVRAADTGWGTAGTVAALLLAAAAFAGLVVWERRAPAPMLPPHLFRNRGFTAAATAALLMTAALMAAVFLTAQYFQAALGYSPLGAGLRLLPWTATPLIVAPIAGAVADRVGPRRPLATGLVLQGVGLIAFAVQASVHPSYAALCLPLVVAGVGASMALPTMAAAAIGSVPPAQIGTASGVSNTMQRTGGALGIAVVSTVFASYGHLGSPAEFVAGFRPAIVVAAGLSLLGAVVATAIPRGHRHVEVRTGVTAEPAAAHV